MPEIDFSKQEQERNDYTQLILDSDAAKKIIVAGAGTGKTYTFGQILRTLPKGNCLVLTFIKKLKEDMKDKLDSLGTVQTFHEFSIRKLLSVKQDLRIYPKIYKIIESDADYRIQDIGGMFQRLEVDNDSIRYCFARMSYYKTHGFDDALYMLLERIKSGNTRFRKYNVILIDEYQDFNALEVELINELEQHGNIVIVGDDEQAIYDFRNSSPDYLRHVYQREDFTRFELPYCSRCTDVIVEATKDVIKSAVGNGYLTGHVPRQYTCFTKDKMQDNTNYPKIGLLELREPWNIPTFIINQIGKISQDAIVDSQKEGDSYPTVLILGSKLYLNLINSKLSETGYTVQYQQSDAGKNVKLGEGYRFLIDDENSNIGWRIICEYCMNRKQILEIIQQTENGTRIVDLLPEKFVSAHKNAVKIIKEFDFEIGSVDDLYELLFPQIKKTKSTAVCKFFSSGISEVLDEEEDDDGGNETIAEQSGSESAVEIPGALKPTIVLSTIMKSKGLQAGFVFIVGANNGEFPENPFAITDNEICQFIVALTRAKKKCFIISNRQSIDFDKETKKRYNRDKSEFINWIDNKRIQKMDITDVFL